MRITAAGFATLVSLLFITAALPVFAAEPTATERLFSLKTHLAESQAVLRQYEWTETATVSIEGEERSHSRTRCYYGADGFVNREPIHQPAGKPVIHDLRFNMPEVKREDLSGEMQKAMNLVRQYIPLNLTGIQAVTEDGKLSFSETDPGKLGRLTIRDFLKRGDRVELDLDLLTNSPLSLKIYSFYEVQTDSVTVAVIFGSLYGTATFAREIVLQDREKKLKALIRNTDYGKTVTVP